jgi:hypothetical protein
LKETSKGDEESGSEAKRCETVSGGVITTIEQHDFFFKDLSFCKKVK